MTTTTQAPVIHEYSVGAQVEFKYANAPRKGAIVKLSICSDLIRKPLGESYYQAVPCYSIQETHTHAQNTFTYIRQTDIISVFYAPFSAKPSGFMPVLLTGKKDLWTRIGAAGKYGYALKADYCYPNTVILLEHIGETPAKAPRYRVLMRNIKSGVTVDLENHYVKDVAQANGLAKRYDVDWILRVGIVPDYPFHWNQRVGVLENGVLIKGVVVDFNLEWVTVKAEDSGLDVKARPQNVRV